MDKIALFKQAIHAVLPEHALPPSQPSDEHWTHLIMDDERGHYLILDVGWRGMKRQRGISIHLDIIGDKIWIQQNGTDSDIAAELMAHGVAREDIVLGLLAPATRKYSDYAA